jgi:hypothetical protein
MNEDIERLVRLETKLDVVLDNQSSFRSLFEKHDERIKNLENYRSHLVGISAAVGATVTALLTALVSAFKNTIHT